MKYGDLTTIRLTFIAVPYTITPCEREPDQYTLLGSQHRTDSLRTNGTRRDPGEAWGQFHGWATSAHRAQLAS